MEHSLPLLLTQLTSRVQTQRSKAASQIRDLVDTTSRDSTTVHVSKILNIINRKIFVTLSEGEQWEKNGAVEAIDKLIDFEGEDNTTKITRFANYLRMVLPGSEPATMMMAAKALGKVLIYALVIGRLYR